MTSNNKPLRCILWIAVSSEIQADDDKTSLPQQEADLRARANKEGWTVVDVLIIPGFSRRYLTWQDFATSAAKSTPPIDAPTRMLHHWQAKDFDIIAFRDGSRFGRSQSIFAYFVERTIDGGAKLYSLIDGWITPDNYRMYAAMGGYGAAGEIDRLIRGRKIAMSARAKRGLFTNYKPALSHIAIYDNATGKLLKVALDETKTVLFQHVYELLIARLSWSKMEIELYNRWGHVNPNTGKRYAKSTIQQAVYNPNFWGHTGRYYDHLDIGQAWVHEDYLPAPEGVELTRHTIDPVWTGEQAQRARDELLRRETFSTNSRPNQKTAFAGLLMCGGCGYLLSCRTSVQWVKRLNATKRFARWQCSAANWGALHYQQCDRKSISNEDVQNYIDKLLRALLQSGDLTLLSPSTTGSSELNDLSNRLAALRQDYEDAIVLQRTARTLAEKQRHQEALDSLVEQIEIVEKAQAQLRPDNHELALAALQRLKIITAQSGTDRFWQMEPGEQNQWLHALFGQMRLVVLDGKIIGRGRYQRKPTGRRKRDK